MFLTESGRQVSGLRLKRGAGALHDFGFVLGRGGEYSDVMKFRVIIEPDENGVFVAECPVLPGCVSQGHTRDEAMANIRDAIQGYLQSLEKHGEPVPG